MKDGLAGIFSKTDLLRRKSVGPERACRKTAPEAESAAEKGAVTKNTENAGDGVDRADAAEDGAQSFARGVGACVGYQVATILEVPSRS